MKVCAHITYGPFNHGYKAFANIKEAADFFENEVAGTDYGTGLGEQTMYLNEADDSCPCNDYMNFHDYPEHCFVVAVDGSPVAVAV